MKIQRYILDDHLRDESPDGDWVLYGDIKYLLKEFFYIINKNIPKEFHEAWGLDEWFNAKANEFLNEED